MDSHTRDPIVLDVAFTSGGGLPLFHEADASQQAEGRQLVAMATKDTDPATGRVLSATMTWGAPDRAMPAGRGGRLGVFIPTLNCADQLPRQIEAMAGWLDLVDEIVVVDGGSTDGTLEYLAENLRHPRLRVVQHPRGLWQSWNAGLALLSTEYVWIGTAGDAMERAGAEHLLAAMRETGADVLISPPRFAMHDGSPPLEENWPIHSLIKEFKPDGPMLMRPEDVLHWTFWFGGWGGGILSSSASNLYRTRLLQEYPFPTDASFAGDTAWGLRHIKHAKVAITPRHCALFVHYPQSLARPPGSVREMLFRSACLGIGLTDEGWIAKLEQSRSWSTLEKEHHRALAAIRKRLGPLWMLSKEAWRHRRERRRLREDMERMHASAPFPAHFKEYLTNYNAHQI